MQKLLDIKAPRLTNIFFYASYPNKLPHPFFMKLGSGNKKI
jgi:hypothetical protein